MISRNAMTELAWFRPEFCEEDSRCQGRVALIGIYMRSTYDASDHFFRDNGRALRSNDSLDLFASIIPTCIRATKRGSSRTSELTNSIATSNHCSKSATGLAEV